MVIKPMPSDNQLNAQFIESTSSMYRMLVIFEPSKNASALPKSLLALNVSSIRPVIGRHWFDSCQELIFFPCL